MRLPATRALFTGLAAIVVVLGGSGCVATAITPTPASSAPAAFAEAMIAPLETWRTSSLDGSMEYEIPGTVVGASVGDASAEIAASGDALIGDEKLHADDLFHIGSMTKLFTAALIMQLDEEGVLSLDDTLDTWFASAPNASTITVKMLLEHESGLYELDFGLVGTATNQELVENVFAQAPIAEPGTSYQYLNAGYIILGRIAEEAAKTPYDTQVEARFIEPLGLGNTYLDGYGDGVAAVDGYELGCAGAIGSDCLGKASTPNAVEPSPQWTGAWSAGGMVSTASDQVTWIRALVAGDVLDQQHNLLMRTLTPLSSAYYSGAYASAGLTAVQLGEGAGLASWAVPGLGTCVGHAGVIPGSNGIVAYCADVDLAIAILNNVDPAGTSPGYPGLVELAPEALKALGD